MRTCRSRSRGSSGSCPFAGGARDPRAPREERPSECVRARARARARARLPAVRKSSATRDRRQREFHAAERRDEAARARASISLARSRRAARASGPRSNGGRARSVNSPDEQAVQPAARRHVLRPHGRGCASSGTAASAGSTGAARTAGRAALEPNKVYAKHDFTVAGRQRVLRVGPRRDRRPPARASAVHQRHDDRPDRRVRVAARARATAAPRRRCCAGDRRAVGGRHVAAVARRRRRPGHAPAQPGPRAADRAAALAPSRRAQRQGATRARARADGARARARTHCVGGSLKGFARGAPLPRRTRARACLRPSSPRARGFSSPRPDVLHVAVRPRRRRWPRPCNLRRPLHVPLLVAGARASAGATLRVRLRVPLLADRGSSRSCSR